MQLANENVDNVTADISSFPPIGLCDSLVSLISDEVSENAIDDTGEISALKSTCL